MNWNNTHRTRNSLVPIVCHCECHDRDILICSVCWRTPILSNGRLQTEKAKVINRRRATRTRKKILNLSKRK